MWKEHLRFSCMEKSCDMRQHSYLSVKNNIQSCKKNHTDQPFFGGGGKQVTFVLWGHGPKFLLDPQVSENVNMKVDRIHFCCCEI